MGKIEKLTKEQESMMEVYRDRWTSIGLSTDPTDRKRAENGIVLAYLVANLKPPKIVWCGSPLSNSLTRAYFDARRKVGVWASVRASVWDSVWDSVRASVRASVGDSVWASVGDSVWDSVGDSVWASVGDSVWDSVGDSGYGQHDANWIAFFQFFREVCGLKEQTEKLQGLVEICKSAGWFLPHQNICWISERHNILNRDERGRLHSLIGPAVQYPDKWKIYSVHGVRVPRDIIENPNGITVNRIREETNAEVRRVMIDLFTPERYLIESGASEISRDKWGILYRADLPNDEPLVMVFYKDASTAREYFHRVHPECRPIRRLLNGSEQLGDPQSLTPKNAIASTFGKRGEEYNPAFQS